MRTAIVLVTALATAAMAGCASTPGPDDPVQVRLNDLDTRLTRIERVISNQSLVDLAQHLDSVQADVRQLRGRIEELEYKQDAIKKQQRDLYSDLDKRLAAGSSTTATGGDASNPSGSAAIAGTPPSATGSAGTAAGAAAGTDAGGAGASSEEQQVYAQSFDALKAGSYSIAITGFKSFLTSYPSSPLAENAQYWLGEAYYVTHDLDAAAGAFRAVLSKWPDSRKSPDALLKLGYTQLDQKKIADGRATLQQVTQKYPNTEAARLATTKLQSTSAGGR